MSTVIIKAEINDSDVPLFQLLFERMKVKKVVIKEKDDAKMSKEEYFSKLDASKKQIKDGQYTKLSDYENFDSFINSL